MPRLLDVIETGDRLGEGPLWDPHARRLWWTDIQGRRIRNLDLQTREITDIPTPERVGSFAFVAGQPRRLLAAFETGLAFLELNGGGIDWIARPETLGGGRRFNDGRTDRQGRFWAGTMVEDQTRAPPASASLWRLDASGVLTACQTNVSIANGLATSLDGRTLYFADSPTQTIVAYDLDPETGAIDARRLFAEVERGVPDGATIDAEDCLWSARWGAGEVVRHAPDGSVLEVIRTLVSQPTCVTFAGEDLSLLIVTSATDGLTAREQAEQCSAGGLFIYESMTRGVREVEFQSASRPLT